MLPLTMGDTAIYTGDENLTFMAKSPSTELLMTTALYFWPYFSWSIDIGERLSSSSSRP